MAKAKKEFSVEELEVKMTEFNVYSSEVARLRTERESAAIESEKALEAMKEVLKTRESEELAFEALQLKYKEMSDRYNSMEAEYKIMSDKRNSLSNDYELELAKLSEARAEVVSLEAKVAELLAEKTKKQEAIKADRAELDNRLKGIGEYEKELELTRLALEKRERNIILLEKGR